MPKIISKLITPDSPFDPEAFRQLIAEYNINPVLDTVDDFPSSAFKQYASDRVQNISGLKSAKTPAGDLIAEKLSKTPDAPGAAALTTALNQVFAGSAAFTQAQINYDNTSSNFKKFVNSLPKTNRKAASLYGLLKEMTDAGVKAIEEQQKHEIEKLNAVLNNHDQLKQALNVTDEQLEAVKKSIRDDLEATHKNHLAAFNKSTGELTSKLLKKSAQQMHHDLFKAALDKDSPEMQKMLKDIAARNQGESIPSHRITNIKKDDIEISPVNLEELPYFKLLGGREIVKIKDTDTYTLKLSSAFFNPWYRFNDQHKTDLLALAQVIRARGSKTILMSINNDTTDTKVAREAYAACIKSGFAPEDITIKFNGTYYTAKEMKNAKIKGIGEVESKSLFSEIFKDHQSDFQNLGKLSVDRRKELDALDERIKFNPINATEQAEMKSKLREFVTQHSPRQEEVITESPQAQGTPP